MLRPDDILRDDSWLNILEVISRGGHPKLQDLAAALRRGEAVPVKVQGYIAGLLDGSIKKRGTPPKWSNPFAYVELRRSIDKAKRFYADGRWDRGNLTPAEAAYDWAAREYCIDNKTAKKYYGIGGQFIRKFTEEGWPEVLVSEGPAVRPLELTELPPKK